MRKLRVKDQLLDEDKDQLISKISHFKNNNKLLEKTVKDLESRLQLALEANNNLESEKNTESDQTLDL